MSGQIPEGLRASVAAGERPRADYLEIADSLGAELLARPAAGARGRLGGLAVRVVGENVAMAWSCWRRRGRHDVILSDGEQVGLPLAMFLSLLGRRRVKHVMIVHIMSVPKKATLFRLARLGRGVDGYVVYSSAQERFITARLGVPADRVFLRPFMVDTRFFRPPPALDDRSRAAAAPGQATITTAGLEFRDYPTLLKAIGGIDAQLVVGAASPWSKRSNELDGVTVPDNVTVGRFTLAELRDLYARSTLAVMPLYPSEFQAGITTILEAMAMQLPVVCTRTPGQTDTIVDGVTGVYVPPGDPTALRAAMVSLLADAPRRDQLGSAARAWVVEHAELDRYVELLAEIVDRYRPALTR
ncbi:MAG: glycosyltransferase family 4 protein [Ilumatobacteraceae bacterium]